jgi:hypothetical protein
MPAMIHDSSNSSGGNQHPAFVHTQLRNQAPQISSIEQRFGALGADIIENLYVSEVLAALDHCFQVVTNNLSSQQ